MVRRERRRVGVGVGERWLLGVLDRATWAREEGAFDEGRKLS